MKKDDAAFAALFEKIERERGFRGNSYRQKCLRRRVSVRMRSVGVTRPEEYSAVLDSDPGEYERLLRALTINVSRFFRNPETWSVIAEQVLPDLLSRSGRLVLWSAGSAAGEEAYSLAILVTEWLGQRGMTRSERRLRIIGTDIDADAIEAARAARYPAIALSETSPSVRRRWFAGDDPYVLSDEIRSQVQFQHLDILKGRPEFDSDLIICRNLLIYLDQRAQESVFQSFAETLRPRGYLVLGRVEMLAAGIRPYFEVISARERVYRKR